MLTKTVLVEQQDKEMDKEAEEGHQEQEKEVSG